MSSIEGFQIKQKLRYFTVAAVQLAHKFGAPPSVKESRPFIDLSLTTHDLPFAQRL